MLIILAFGCLGHCVLRILSLQGIPNLITQATLAIFIGYPPGMKDQRLFDIVNKKVFVSNDVVFYEHIYPFHETTLHDSLLDHFPYLVLPHSFDFSCHTSCPSTITHNVVLLKISPDQLVSSNHSPTVGTHNSSIFEVIPTATTDDTCTSPPIDTNVADASQYSAPKPV